MSTPGRDADEQHNARARRHLPPLQDLRAAGRTRRKHVRFARAGSTPSRGPRCSPADLPARVRLRRAIAKRIGVERILELVRNPARAFPVRLQALCFRFALAACIDRVGHVAHAVAQRRELGRAARYLCVARRQWLAAADARGPSDDLIQRPAHLPAEVSRDSRGGKSKENEEEYSADDHQSSRAAGEEAVAPRLLERSVQLTLVLLDELTLIWASVWRA